MRTITAIIPLILTAWMSSSSVNAQIVVISHEDIQGLNTNMVKRIYTGRIIEIDGVDVIPVNSMFSDPIREKFLYKYLGQDEDKYSAYWTVRRFIGKGTPPKELNGSPEILEFIRHNSGAVGYVDDESVSIPSSVNVFRD